ncbi:hypothetical protein NIES2101_26805 [Calothrix sp. HK-06]|nr:hypothetical protein NIES2101_26805 [Calothrix sp. HK-06]
MCEIKSTSCCYLIKLSEPLGSNKHKAQYYLGATKNLSQRFKEHCSGVGARFTQAAVERGIKLEIVHVWYTRTAKDAYHLERKLRRQKNNRKLYEQIQKEKP